VNKVLNIYGTIGSGTDKETGKQMFSSDRVLNAVSGLKKGDTLIVNIDSNGGSVEEGQKIYNLLKASPANVITRVVGNCYSIATVILMAGKQIEALPNARFMVHRAHTPKTSGNAAQLKKDAAYLESLDKEIVKVYKSRAKDFVNSPDFQDLYQGEMLFNTKKALELGFIDSVSKSIIAQNKQIEAFNYKFEYNPNNNNSMNKELTILDRLTGMADRLLGKGLKAQNSPMQYKLVDGTEIIIHNGESGMPEVGSLVELVAGGNAPEGEHVLEDGTTIVVDAAGMIAEIKVKEELETEELAKAKKDLEAANAKIAELTAENSKLAGEMSAINSKLPALEAALNKALDAQNKFDPAPAANGQGGKPKPSIASFVQFSENANKHFNKK
jgi:ATP-dependent protease ClpP protease subunit